MRLFLATAIASQTRNMRKFLLTVGIRKHPLNAYIALFVYKGRSTLLLNARCNFKIRLRLSHLLMQRTTLEKPHTALFICFLQTLQVAYKK